MPETKWKPTDSDLAWTRELIGSLNDGGTWSVPAVGIYVIDHAEKKLCLQHRWPVSDEEMHQMIVTTFGECGYEVVEEETEDLN
jgi:hypothetical protein